MSKQHNLPVTAKGRVVAIRQSFTPAHQSRHRFPASPNNTQLMQISRRDVRDLAAASCRLADDPPLPTFAIPVLPPYLRKTCVTNMRQPRGKSMLNLPLYAS
jgi:hypothetical protein